MKKGFIVLIAIGAVLLLIGLFYGIFFLYSNSVYNKAIRLQEDTYKTWGNVESAYQRRADLIPNLVNTVKGYAEHEQQTLTNVIEARSKATSVTIDPQNLSQSNIAKFQAAQGELTSALSRLMLVVERYPDLKANQNFIELQAQLEGTENRINVARQKYNQAVSEFNTHIRGFIREKALGFLGKKDEFERLEPFKAAPVSHEVPDVQF